MYFSKLIPDGWMTFTVDMPDAEMLGPSNKLSLSAGRPTKKLHECSERAKRYKIQQLRDSYSKEQLKAAAGSGKKFNKARIHGFPKSTSFINRCSNIKTLI